MTIETFTTYVRFPQVLTPRLTDLLAPHGGRLWRPVAPRGRGSDMLRSLWNPAPNTEDATVEIEAASAEGAAYAIRRALGEDVEFLYPPTVV